MKYPVLKGSERFHFHDDLRNETVTDFWAWAMSRLLADGPRGDLAEFLVNTALGMDMTNAKRGWGECDILYDGVRIEVKCSSVLQAWDRKQPSKPVFSISKTLNCDIQETETGLQYVGRDGLPPKRRSEIYVFCLFANSDRETADPMDLAQWEFYIVPTSILNEKCGDRRSISLGGIARLGFHAVGFHEIRPTVDRIIAGTVHGPFDTVDELMQDLDH